MITERMQCSYLYRKFIEDEDIELDPTNWSDPWRTICLIAERDDNTIIGSTPLYNAVRAVAADFDETRSIMGRIEAAAQPLHFPSLADIADSLPPITWVWPGWLPRGMLSLIGAFPGVGKSYFVLDLVRRVVDGDVWPDGQPITRHGKAIYVDAEAMPQLTNARAKEMGVDSHQVHMLFSPHTDLIDLTQRYWQDTLMDMAHTLRPELIVIDSLSNISSGGQNSVEDTNGLFMYLVNVARDVDCGLLLVHHLRKPPSGQLSLPMPVGMHDFRGSSHIIAMSRSIMGLSITGHDRRGPKLNSPRLLNLVKTNLGSEAPSLLITQQKEGETVRFEYTPSEQEPVEAEQTCEDWLLEYLEANGATRFKELLAAAEQEGFTKSAVWRARKRLNGKIADTEGPQHPKNRWVLADQADECENEEEDQ